METEDSTLAGNDGGGCKAKAKPASENAEWAETPADAGDSRIASGRRRASTTTATPPPSSFQTSSTEARVNAGISNGDWPHVNGALNMTVSGTKNEDAYDEGVETASAVVADARGSPESSGVHVTASSSPSASSNEDDGETPMNLSPEGGDTGDKNDGGEEAMNLCPPPLTAIVTKKEDGSGAGSGSGSATYGLSAKMRLKKQRLAAFAAQEEQMRNAAAATSEATSTRTASGNSPSEIQNVAPAVDNNKESAATTTNGNFASFHENDQTSALHRLAEAAQRKQVKFRRPHPLFSLLPASFPAKEKWNIRRSSGVTREKAVLRPDFLASNECL